MRQIGTLSSALEAAQFEDFLLTKGIKSMLEQEAEKWIVWIYDEDHIEPAKQELAAFVANPDDARFQDIERTANDLRTEEVNQQEQARKNVVDVRKRWNAPLASRCPVAFSMIAISVLVAIGSNLGDKHEPFVKALSIASYTTEGRTISWSGLRDSRNDIRNGQVWRLVTPIFIHFGIMHILFNMLWLRDLGSAIEFRRGSGRFILMVLTIALSSNLAQYFSSGPAFGGMSGVVFGLFGYIWMKSRYDPESGFFMHPNTVFLMIGWFLICLTGFMPIANTAHGVGLVSGMVMGYVPKLWRDAI